MVIYRHLHIGTPGISIPCVICRKAVEKYKINWIAYDGTRWVNSEKTENIPKSKPTSKQKRNLKFT